MKSKKYNSFEKMIVPHGNVECCASQKVMKLPRTAPTYFSSDSTLRHKVYLFTVQHKDFKYCTRYTIKL